MTTATFTADPVKTETKSYESIMEVPPRTGEFISIGAEVYECVRVTTYFTEPGPSGIRAGVARSNVWHCRVDFVMVILRSLQ